VPKFIALLLFATLGLGSAQAQVFNAAGSGYDLIDKTTAWGNLATPSSVNYATSFDPLLNPVLAGSTGNFYDDYTFTIASGVTDSITSSITLGSLIGISGLQARLYTGSGPFTGATGGSVLDMAWGTSFSAGTVTVTNVVLAPYTLGAGTYTLEIIGKVLPSGIGSYAGVLNITAVPEPLNWTLMALGLVLVAFATRLRRERGARFA
jgi:hypothetical protein